MPGTSRVFGYPADWLSGDLVAGLTLAAYAIPVSLAYATLAGLPPQVGIMATSWAALAMLWRGHPDTWRSARHQQSR